MNIQWDSFVLLCSSLICNPELRVFSRTQTDEMPGLSRAILLSANPMKHYLVESVTSNKTAWHLMKYDKHMNSLL